MYFLAARNNKVRMIRESPVITCFLGVRNKVRTIRESPVDDMFLTGEK